MKKNCILIIVFGLAAFAQNGMADSFTLPLQIDYSLIKNALASQLYTGAGHTADLWNDKKGCSHLKLSDPRISGQNGQIQLLNQVQAKLGTAMGGQCLTVLNWEGVLETWQKPTIDKTQTVLSFPVTKASAYDAQGRQLTINQLQDLLTRFAEPRLGGLKVDLNESRSDIEHNIAYYLPKQKEAEAKQLLDTLKFSSVAAKDDGIAVKFAFNATVKPLPSKPAAPLTEIEQQQWQNAWRRWDEFLSKAIQQAYNDTQSQELRDTLMEILQESRRAFQSGLKDQKPGSEDPVRVFFTHTWEQLVPELKKLAKQMPELQGLRYMTFIAATDVIYELENIGRPFGLEISSDGLRKLGRMLIEGQKEQQASGPANFPKRITNQRQGASQESRF